MPDGLWIRKPKGEASAVFVHGILSSAEAGWRNDNKCYWPDLLKDELELGSLGIYVFSYETSLFSGSYRLGDIVDALKEHMGLDGVLKSKKLIFVCHSMGGIVVRKYIVERAVELTLAKKQIGLFLVASPSLGSSYADWLSPLVQRIGNAQAGALRSARHNDWLMDLDEEFKNLKEGGKLKIKGKELIEDEFVALQKIWGRQVVEPFSAARYFPEPFKVPGSDHFSIAKPKDKNAIQHLLLCQFILGKPPHRMSPPPDDPLPDTGVDKNDQFSGSDVIKPTGYLAMTALGASVTWLIAGPVGALGPALTALFSILGSVSSLAVALIYGRYFRILGAGGVGRESYARLRTSLASGGYAWNLYKNLVNQFFDKVDQFFDDVRPKVRKDPKLHDDDVAKVHDDDVAKAAGHSLFPQAFGLKTPAPLWTPRSFDRCLFLALVYPIATIFVIWTAAGRAGPAEQALGLNPNLPGLQRGLIAAAAIFAGFVLWSFFRGEEQKSAVWKYVAKVWESVARKIGVRASARATAIAAALIALGAVAGAAALTFWFGSVGVGAVAFGAAVVAAVTKADRVAGAVTVATAVPIAFGLAFGLADKPYREIALAVAIAAATTFGILLLSWVAIKCKAQGVFLFLFIPAAIMACLAAVSPLLPLTTWRHTGPLLLFQGLLTLVNAPFNWVSIGLTRALLRRGLELKGWWPYFLAIINVLLATAIVAALALTMVIAIQAFDEVVAFNKLLVHVDWPFSGIALEELFEGIYKNPSAPEYWWVYALLLATMIPSLVNLMIGGASLISGIPGLSTLLLQFMPEGKVESWDRTWLAVLLTFQTFFGAILGAAAGGFLVVLLSVYVMPDAGLSVLDLASAVMDYNLPARVGQFLASFR